MYYKLPQRSDSATRKFNGQITSEIIYDKPKYNTRFDWRDTLSATTNRSVWIMGMRAAKLRCRQPCRDTMRECGFQAGNGQS